MGAWPAAHTRERGPVPEQGEETEIRCPRDSDEGFAKWGWAGATQDQDVEELLARHRRRVLRVLVGVTGSFSEAEVLWEATRCEARRALPQMQPGLPFRTWVLWVAVKACARWIERQERSQQCPGAGSGIPTGRG